MGISADGDFEIPIFVVGDFKSPPARELTTLQSGANYAAVGRQLRCSQAPTTLQSGANYAAVGRQLRSPVTILLGGDTGDALEVAIEGGDGTSHYFDMQGRLLQGKPDKGLYIENGKKTVTK